MYSPFFNFQGSCCQLSCLVIPSKQNILRLTRPYPSSRQIETQDWRERNTWQVDFSLIKERNRKTERWHQNQIEGRLAECIMHRSLFTMRLRSRYRKKDIKQCSAVRHGEGEWRHPHSVHSHYSQHPSTSLRMIWYEMEWPQQTLFCTYCTVGGPRESPSSSSAT